MDDVVEQPEVVKRVDEVIGDVELGRVGATRMKKLRDVCADRVGTGDRAAPAPAPAIPGIFGAIRSNNPNSTKHGRW